MIMGIWKLQKPHKATTWSLFSRYNAGAGRSGLEMAWKWPIREDAEREAHWGPWGFSMRGGGGVGKESKGPSKQL